MYGIIEIVNEFFYNFSPIQKSMTSDYNKNLYENIWIMNENYTNIYEKSCFSRTVYIIYFKLSHSLVI